MKESKEENKIQENIIITNGKKDNTSFPSVLPVLPLKDIVIFPYMVFPILAGRESTVNAINTSLESDKYILVISQVDATIEDTTSDNLYKTGTIAKILQVLRLPNGLIKVLVDGLVPATVEEFYTEKYIKAKVVPKFAAYLESNELQALIRHTTKMFNEYVSANPTIPKESIVAYDNIKEPDRKLYYIASTINVDIAKKQKVLEIDD